MTGKSIRTTVIIIIAAVLLLAASIAEMLLVFNITSEQNRQSGTDRLEVICGELEETINEEKLSTMRFAAQLQPYLDERSKCEEQIRSKKAEMLELTGGVCFNVYAAGGSWYYIPDFVAPDGYEVKKRSWYLGAVKKGGEPYVTDPYVDAMTGNVCFTVSVLLEDSGTVVAMDYTMEEVQKHIKQMYKEENTDGQSAVIVTEEGIIAGCTDEKLLGKNLIQNLPDYGGIFSLVKNSSHTVSISQRDDNLFALRSGFGWFLIVSENNSSLYRTSYMQIMVMLVLSLAVFGIVLTMYIITSRNAKRAEARLDENLSFISDIASQLRKPIDRINNLADSEEISAGSERELAGIRGYGRELSEMTNRLRSYSELVKSDSRKRKKNKHPAEITVSRHFRSIILGALLVVMAVTLYINISSSVRNGKMQMQKAAGNYEYQLSEWINTQKSILDMFSSTVSTNPEMLDDYKGTVEYLDRITKQYPEISVCYMTNPDLPHTVYMNNGWEPDDDWHVEERDWYKDLMNSDNNWLISSPYYDEQTGLYCVTFAEKVYDHETGEFLGNFGIDFYMDKLVDILGGSYTDSGYAFLADASGEIINHPYGKYQMSENGSTNIVKLPYNEAAPSSGDVSVIKDYDGSYKVMIAERNTDSGFGIYVVDNIWSIYSDVFIYGAICLIVLTLCVVIVYKVMSSLIALQEQANIKLRESAEAAIAADEAKSSFLAQMSHEIRTPINAVLGMNEMILHKSTDAEITDYASNIRSSGKTLLSLINSILDFSKIESGKMEILPVKYDTAVMISELEGSISARAAGKGLDLIIDADESLPRSLKGDDVRIKQVILNLLTNAVKYTEKGFVRFTVTGRQEADIFKLRVSVADSGIGINADDMEGLFESFKRLDEKRNRNIEGTGLGMSIVTRLLEMMNSKLEVQSVYGEGSTFSFEIEQGVIDSEPMGSYRLAVTDTDTADSDMRLSAPAADVLVVDDNAMNLKVAASLMQLFGITADTVDSGEAALAKLSEKRYDIVFLDHMMPKMDGIETLNEVKKRGLTDGSTTVIALTANAIVGAKEKYLSAGFNGYLTKPIECKELEAILISALPEDKKQFIVPEKHKPQSADPDDSDSLTFDEIIKLRELCPELNIGAGMGYCMDSKEFWLDTLSGFIETDKSGELCSAFEKKDFELYRITVHGVKSAARTVGAELVSEKARLLEFAARDGNTGYIEASHAGFIEEYKKLTENIERVIEFEQGTIH